MAVTRTLLTSGDDTATNATSFSTASITPAANKPLLLTLFFNSGSGVTAAPTVTGNGLTWTLIGSTDVTTSTAPRVGAMYRAIGAAPTAGAVTITSGDGQTITGSFWSIVQFDGVVTTGTNAADAFKNFVGTRPGAATSDSVAFTATIGAGNATYGCVGIANAELPTAGTGWTADASYSHTAPATGAVFMFAATGVQNVTASWTTSGVSTVVGVEVVASTAVAVVGTATLGEDASNTQVTCNVPTGVVAGELLVAQITHSTSTGLPEYTGWVSAGKASGGSCATGMYYRVATASEPASYTFTGLNPSAAGRCTAEMVRLSGVDTTTPLDTATVGKVTAASGTSITTPALITASNGALVLYGVSRQTATAGDITPATGTTLIINTTGVGRRTILASEARPTAGDTGTRVWNATDATSLGMAAVNAAFRPSNSTASSAGVWESTWLGVPTGTTIPVVVRTTGAGSIRLKIGTDAAVTTGVIFTAAVVPDANGYSRFDVTGLTANTSYWLVPEIDSVLDTHISPFSTDAPATARSFRVAFASCLTSSNPTATAMDNAIANAPELFLHLGDFFYGDLTSTVAADHRALYESQIAANFGLKRLLRQVPIAYVPSDHDSGPNDWTGGPGVQTPAWNLAYRQAVPAPSPLPSTGGAYHSVHRGRVKFIMTDGRSFKSPKANTDDASKTMFGFTQESWIATELADPNYPVKVIAVDVPWVYPTTVGDDKWGGYKAAAQRLINAITSAGANVFMIHGDAHSLCADDGTSANNTGGLAVAGAAPLGNATSIKGGPYSAGTWPTAGAIGTTENQHGLLDITDTGSAITIRFSGRDTANTERITLSKTFSLAAPDTTAPTVPTGVTATATSATSVVISWTASTDAVGVSSYRIRRGGVDLTGATAVAGTSFTDTSVAASTSYSYTVSAVDAAGNRSAESSAATATTPTAPPPSPPVVVTPTSSVPPIPRAPEPVAPTMQVNVFRNNYTRLGTVPDYISCSVSWEWNAVGSGTLVVAEDDPIAASLLTADSTVVPVVVDIGDNARWSGRVSTATLERNGPVGSGVVTATLVHDWVWLQRMLASQNGSNPATTTMPLEDKRTGPMASLAADYINAAASRLAVPVVATKPTPDTSGSQTLHARMTPLSDLLTQPLADSSVTLSAAIWLPGDALPGVTLTTPTVVFTAGLLADKPWLQWTDAMSNIVSLDFQTTAPTAYRVMLGLAGTGTTRSYDVYQDTARKTALGTFGLPEVFNDSGATLGAESQVDGRISLLESAGAISASFEVADGSPWVFGVDYVVGDMATVVVNGLSWRQRVTRVEASDDRANGLVISPTIGDAPVRGSGQDMMIRVLKKLAEDLRAQKSKT